MTDSGNQKLANCFTFPTSALQIKVMAVGPAPRPGPAPEPNAALRVGMMGEAGDFKCLTFVKLKPRPVRKPGLFFKRELRCSASWARWRPLSVACTCGRRHPRQRPTHFARP